MWPQEAIPKLLDCFENTQRSIFKVAATCDNITDLQEYTGAVTGYINKCTDDMTVVRPMKKQTETLVDWVCSLLRTWDAAFRIQTGEEKSVLGYQGGHHENGLPVAPSLPDILKSKSPNHSPHHLLQGHH